MRMENYIKLCNIILKNSNKCTVLFLNCNNSAIFSKLLFLPTKSYLSVCIYEKLE